MFDYQGPFYAQQSLRTFMRAKGNTLPVRLEAVLDAAGDQISPVATCVEGMERMFAALSEVKGDGTAVTNVPSPARAMACQTLGILATAVGHGQFHSKGDRAWLIAAWAANELNPTPGDTPVPDADEAYCLSPPAED